MTRVRESMAELLDRNGLTGCAPDGLKWIVKLRIQMYAAIDDFLIECPGRLDDNGRAFANDMINMYIFKHPQLGRRLSKQQEISANRTSLTALLHRCKRYAKAKTERLSKLRPASIQYHEDEPYGFTIVHFFRATDSWTRIRKVVYIKPIALQSVHALDRIMEMARAAPKLKLRDADDAYLFGTHDGGWAEPLWLDDGDECKTFARAFIPKG